MTNLPIRVGALYSALSPNELLSNIVPLFDIPTPISCDFWRAGANDSYIVTTEKDKYLLRIYRINWRTKSNIEFELSALNYLRQQNVNLAYPVKTIDGELMVALDTAEGERFAILTTFAEGKRISPNKSADAELYGKSIADLHIKSEGFSSQHSRDKIDLKYLIEEPLRLIEPYIKHRDDDWQFLKNYASTLADRVSSNAESLDIGFCHGDLTAGNVHKLNDELTFFDFDCCGFGYRAYDLSVFKWNAKRANKVEERWPAFIKGYLETRHISDQDLALTDDFIAMRHLWLIGFHASSVFTKEFFGDRYFKGQIGFLRMLSEESDV